MPKIDAMPSDKIKFTSSDGEETFTSKIIRFWENCKWMTSVVNRHKTNQPSESSKVKNLFLSGWTKNFLEENVFIPTRNRDARTENHSRSNPENSKKPSCKPSEPSEDHAPLERCDSSDLLLDPSSDKPLAKTEKASTVSGRDLKPGERDPSCSSLPVPPTSPELTDRKPPCHFPEFSYSKLRSAPADNEWRDINSYRPSSSSRCAHQSSSPECFRSGPYSRTQRLLSTDRITTTETSARERLLHRDCPYKTNRNTNYFYRKHGVSGLDCVTSDQHMPSQQLFKSPHFHNNCCPFSWKKQDVDCICRVDCLNSNICSTNSTYCCRSRSYLPSYEYSNDTYSIYTTDDDGQILLSRKHLDHHCLCYTHVSNAEALRRERLEPFKRPSWKVIPSNEERLSRRDVGTSTTDLLGTGRTRLDEVFSSDKACSTQEIIKRFDTGFEPAFNSLHKSLLHGTSKKTKETYGVIDWSVTSHDHVTGQLFPQAKTGNVSVSSKFRNFEKKRSGSFPSPHQSWNFLSDRKNCKWISAKDYKYSEAWRLKPLESRSTEEFESLPYLQSVHNFYPARQLENLTLDSDGNGNSLGNCLFSDSLGTQLNSQDVQRSVSKNSRPRIISDANSNTSRQSDKGCKKHTIINEGNLQSDNCVDRRLKADTTSNGIANIKIIKTDVTNYRKSDPKSFSSFEAVDSKKKDRFFTFRSSSKPKFRALEKLVRYFASTPKKDGSKMAHAQEKLPLCLSPDLLNRPEENATYTEDTDVPSLASWTKKKTFSQTDNTANATVSNCQFPSNLSSYTPSEFFSRPILEKTGFSDTISRKRLCRNPTFLLKPKLTTDCDSLSPHSLVPLITMNLTSSSKKSATRLSLSSSNAGRSQSEIVDNSNPVSNDIKFRRSSSKIFSFKGDFKISEQEEITDFSNLDNEVFEPELSPCNYSNVPVIQVDPL